MTTEFSATQARTVKYWYEKIPYTFSSTINVGRPTNIFNVTDISSATNKTKIAILSDIAANQQAGLTLQVGHMDRIVNTDTTAYPSGLAPTLSGDDRGIRSTKRLSLAVQNSSGAAVNNFQANYAVAVKELSTADKILRGLPLTAEDKVYQQKYNIGAQGIRPLAISEMLKRAFFGRVIDEDEFTYSITVPAGVPTTVDAITANQGEVIVLTSIATTDANADGLTISLSRDDDQDYGQLLASNLSLDTATPLWLPATKTITVSATSTTTASNVPIRFTALRIRSSAVIQAMFGLASASELTGEALNVYNSVKAGVLI